MQFMTIACDLLRLLLNNSWSQRIEPIGGEGVEIGCWWLTCMTKLLSGFDVRSLLRECILAS
jgi:hypothetical protein